MDRQIKAKGLIVQIYQNQNRTQKSKLWETYCIEPILDSKAQQGINLVEFGHYWTMCLDG